MQTDLSPIVSATGRHTFHRWLRRYAADAIPWLLDDSSGPLTSPHHMAPAVETRIVELRRLNPEWGHNRPNTSAPPIRVPTQEVTPGQIPTHSGSSTTSVISSTYPSAEPTFAPTVSPGPKRSSQVGTT
jgi:hypothetical protein